jgi:5-methylcytosine-specific restriction endonuclease McrA
MRKVSCAKWSKENPEKWSASIAKWEKANPEKVRAAGANYRKANPEKCRAKVAEWYKANLEKYRANGAKWQKENPEKIAVSGSKRRAAKYANTPLNEMLTSTEWLAILAQADGHCAYCGKEAKLTLDHVIPLAKGGKHAIDNVVPACLHCNASKGARTPEQWLQSLITGGGSDASKSVREQSLILEGD